MTYFEEYYRQVSSNLLLTAAQEVKKKEIISNLDKLFRGLEEENTKLSLQLQQREQRFHEKFDEKLEMIEKFEIEMMQMKIDCENEIKAMMLVLNVTVL